MPVMNVNIDSQTLERLADFAIAAGRSMPDYGGELLKRALELDGPVSAPACGIAGRASDNDFHLLRVDVDGRAIPPDAVLQALILLVDDLRTRLLSSLPSENQVLAMAQVDHVVEDLQRLRKRG